MEDFLICPECGEHVPVGSGIGGKVKFCPACGSDLHPAAEPIQRHEAPEGECSECGNMFALEKLFDYEGRKVCGRCVHVIRRREETRSRRRRTLIFRLFALVLIAAALYVIKKYHWDARLPFRITEIREAIDSRDRLGSIEVSIDSRGEEEYDRYAVIYALDSRKDMSKAAERVIRESKLSSTRSSHLARWMPDDKSRQCFLGRYGKGGLQWTDPRRRYRMSGNTCHRYIGERGLIRERVQWISPEAIKCDECIKNVAIHAIVFLDKEPASSVKLDLLERDFGSFDVAGKMIVRAQVWCCSDDDWEAASPVFEKECSK
jgi:hypothetical protein